MEKLSLKREVYLLKNSLKSRDEGVEELRADNFCQLDHYDELWKAHDVLLGETQKLHSRIIFLSSGGPVEGSGEWPGSTNCDPKGPGSWPGGLENQLGWSADQAGSSGERSGRSHRWSEG